MCTKVGGQSRWWNCDNACLSKLINTPELTNISVIICIYFRWENIFEQARWLKARFKTICSVIAGVTTYTLYRAGHATIVGFVTTTTRQRENVIEIHWPEKTWTRGHVVAAVHVVACPALAIYCRPYIHLKTEHGHNLFLLYNK